MGDIHKKADNFSRLVTYFMYFIFGSGLSLWALLIPYTKERLALNESQLGSLLMLIGIGAMFAMAIAGKIVSKIGCKIAITFSTCILILALFSINYISDIPLLCVILLLLGIGVGIVDVALNIQAIFVEQSLNKRLMSGFHSMYSGGGFISGMLASFILTKGVHIQNVLIIFLILFICLLLLSIRGLTNSGGETSNQKFTKPNIAILVCGFICFVAYLSEGAFLDWSAIFMIEQKEVVKESAGYSFALFFGAITFGRLMGDRLSNLCSSAKLIAISSLVATIGLMIFLNVSNIWVSYVGCIICGLGVSNIVPWIISATARNKGNISLNSAIAIIMTIGYSGTLIGPALIGYISHATSLFFALYLVVGLLVIVALVVKPLK